MVTRSVLAPLPRSNLMASPRTLSCALSGAFGSRPPSEKRARIGTSLAKCAAFDNLGASAEGVNFPVRHMPLVWAARSPGCLPNRPFKASTRSVGVDCWAMPATVLAHKPNATTAPSAPNLPDMLLISRFSVALLIMCDFAYADHCRDPSIQGPADQWPYLSDVLTRFCPVKVGCVGRQNDNATRRKGLNVVAVELISEAD